MTVESTILDLVAERAVRELWGSRIKTFVPVLALRQAREILYDEESVFFELCSERRTDASMALLLLQERRMGEVVPVMGQRVDHGTGGCKDAASLICLKRKEWPAMMGRPVLQLLAAHLPSGHRPA